MDDKIESILNELIETSKDGEKGFMKSADDAHDPKLKSVFTEGARRCREGATQLQEQVRALGGDPEKSGSVAAAIHRGWMNVKQAVTTRDDKAILEECERGEDYAKAEYKKALDFNLPVGVRAIVERQYQGVIANHDRVRSLRDRYRAGAESDSGALGRQQATSEPSHAKSEAGKHKVGDDWPRSNQQDD